MPQQAQRFYTRTKADAEQAAELLDKSGGTILSVRRTGVIFRIVNPGKNYIIETRGVPLAAMRAFLRGE